MWGAGVIMMMQCHSSNKIILPLSITNVLPHRSSKQKDKSSHSNFTTCPSTTVHAPNSRFPSCPRAPWKVSRFPTKRHKTFCDARKPLPCTDICKCDVDV